MTTIQLIGFVSAVLTTGAFVPQALKTWKTKSTDDLSPLMFALFCCGILGWLIYGILRSDLPMILANSVTICLAGIIMYFIIKPDNTRTISHIGLYTDNLELMKDFYVSVLDAKTGSKYQNPAKGFSSYFLSLSTGTRIELMHSTAGDSKNPEREWGHIAISTGSKKAVDMMYTRIVSMGIEVISEPRTTGDGYYEFLISDPESNKIEITI